MTDAIMTQVPSAAERCYDVDEPAVDRARSRRGTIKPQRRTEGLVVRQAGDEVLVYDLDRHRAHCLNRAAGLVFKHSDGGTSIEKLAAVLRSELDASADEEWVLLAVDQLKKAHLLEGPPADLLTRTSRSRREIMREAGRLGAVLIPLVTSVTAATAGTAATCVGVNGCIGQPLGTPCFCVFPGECSIDCQCDGAGNCVGATCTGAPC